MISVPVGTCPRLRNVFTSSPSPQTVIPAKRLNHLPSGTLRLGVEHNLRARRVDPAKSGAVLLGRVNGQAMPAEDFAAATAVVSRLPPAALDRYLAAVPAMSRFQPLHSD